MQNMVNIQTYKHISQKRISGAAVRCSEEQLFQISKEIGLFYCFKQYDRVWLFDRNLLLEHSSPSHIIRRSDFQANIK